jgi:hypothetical protein
MVGRAPVLLVVSADPLLVVVDDFVADELLDAGGPAVELQPANPTAAVTAAADRTSPARRKVSAFLLRRIVSRFLPG